MFSTGSFVLRRVLPLSSDNDDSSSIAKASAVIFNDALASLIVVAFVPVQGECESES
jgi:hypothetical protein